MEKFQSAYKSHLSTETALLRVYNDVMFNIDRGNGTLLVLSDLSAAFDTIDHQILFHIFEHSLCITDCCWLPTLITLASGGSLMFPACGPPACFSVHLASSAVTPVGVCPQIQG